MRSRSSILWVAAALWLCALPAQAQPHRVCLYLDIGDLLWDASPRAADGHDFREEHGRNEGPTSYPAQRWLARVQDDGTGETLFGWDPLDGSGCADVELPDRGTTLTLEWLRWASWDAEPETGNQVIGYHCRAETGDCTLEIQRETVPVDPAGVTSVIVPGMAEGTEINTVLWAATFAEERFASMDEQPLWESRVYVGYDPLGWPGILPGRTQADRTFGNQPSIVIEGDAWHSKFTVAHEYGHQQTHGAHHDTLTPDDVDYCYPEVGCRADHRMDSREWQAAAAIEAFGTWYALATWHDVDLVECPLCMPGVRYVDPLSATEASEYTVPRGDSICGAEPECPPGAGNEWDWMSALRIYRLSIAPPPDFRSMFTMLPAAYATGGWTASGATDAFWTNFDGAMANHLGARYPAWRAAAIHMEIDR